MKRNKGLGQHFLKCEKCLRKWQGAMGNYAIYLEIGGGDGAITRIIPRELVVIEIDGRFAEVLSKRFHGRVVRADATRLPLKSIGKDTLIVSNLPYNAAVRILLEVIVSTESDLLIGVQEEFADKIVASPGAEMYSGIGVIAQNFFECRKLFRMDGACFMPRARVNSAAVSLVRKQSKAPRNLSSIFNVLTKLLSQRNKNLSWLTRKYGVKMPKEYTRRKIGSLSPVDLLNAAAVALQGYGVRFQKPSGVV